MGLDVLRKWQDVFSQSTFLLTDILHQLGWWIALGLKFLCDAAQSLVDSMYSLLDFTQYGDLTKIFTTTEVRLLLGILFAFALIVLGITLIFQKDKERPKVLQNLLIAVMIITALPSLMTMLNDLTLDAKDAILGSETKMSDQLIADNVVDLLYIDSQGFENYDIVDGHITGGAVNGFASNPDSVEYIDVCEKVTDDMKNDLNSPDYFFNVIETNKDGTQVVQEIKADKFFGLDFTGWYYRYNVDYLVIYISLLATTIAFFFVAFKVAKLIFDLAVHGVLATIFAASDLTNGQRTKQVLQSIGSIYVVLVLAVLMIKFYYLGSAYISSTISNGLVKAIALVFFAFAVIDGPNIIEKVLGIDVGLRSGFQTMATMFMATSAVKSVFGGIGRMAGWGAGVAAGAAGGIKDGIQNFKNEKGSSSALKNESSSNSQSSDNKQNNSQNTSPTNNLYGDNKPDDTNNNPTSQSTENAANGQNDETDKSNLNAQQDEAAAMPTGTDQPDAAKPTDNLQADNIDAGNTPPPADNLGADNLNGNTPIDDKSNLNAGRDSLNDSSIQETANSGMNIPDNFQGTINIDNSTNRMQSMPANPNSVIGTIQRAYHTTRGIGGTIGKKAGQTARKRAEKKASKEDKK